MNQRFLLKEIFNLCPNDACSLQFLNEEEKKLKSNGHMILSGIIQRADVKNHNGRIYPKKILIREVNNFQKSIREARAIGELDHNDLPEVSLKNSSHRMLRVWFENDNDVYGTLQVLSTPQGQTLKSLINDGVTVGISSRSLGSLTESSQGSIVNEDLQLITWDVVSESSCQGAYLQLQESKNYENKIFTKGDRIYRCLNSILMSK